MKTIAIIGGGAAGLAAAVEASREAKHSGVSAEVTVYEAADRVGKSILATGNGRCNVSNARIEAGLYRNAGFVGEALCALAPDEVLARFGEMGLLVREETEGRLYPLANKASSVLDVLRFAARESGVRESCGVEVAAVTPVGERFLVSFAGDSAVFADAAVIACGGTVAQSILPPGYPFTATRPVLGPLRTGTAPIKGLNNIRARCAASLWGTGETLCENGEAHSAASARDVGASRSRQGGRPLKAREVGEVLFREYGVSGIAAFDLSRFAEPGDVLSIDFTPDTGEGELAADIASRVERFGSRSAVELLAGMLLAPVARAVLASIGARADEPLPHGKAEALAHAVKSFDLEVAGVGDARQCQVARGGFAVESFYPETMESRMHAGLFAAGEALDVDAPCGGFNLHWAWTSGALAGRAAAGRLAR